MLDVEKLISNEKEWRRYLINKIDRIEEKLSRQQAWHLVFRFGGGLLFVIVFWILGVKNVI